MLPVFVLIVLLFFGTRVALVVVAHALAARPLAARDLSLVFMLFALVLVVLTIFTCRRPCSLVLVLTARSW